MLNIIAFNRQHFEHICHLYRIEKDQARFIQSSNQLRGLHPEAIVIFGDEWWRRKAPEEIKMIETFVEIHNSRRKKNG